MAQPLIQVLERQAHLVWMALQATYPELRTYKVPKVGINNRLWKVAGYAYCEEHRVEFGSKFFGRYKPQMLLEIVPHELIHVADFIINGNDMTDGGHGIGWRNMMRAYGLEPNRYHNLHINKSDPIITAL